MTIYHDSTLRYILSVTRDVTNWHQGILFRLVSIRKGSFLGRLVLCDT